ncbi:MAG: hypothetical protein RLZZ403_1836 [Pseudomonadota bacterium]
MYECGMPLAQAYRFYWRTLWSCRANSSKAEASGRTTYGKPEALIAVADIAAALRLKPTDSLLDIGCAKGLIGDELRPLVARYVGVDYIQAFRPMVTGDAIALPFRTASFDKVLLAGVLPCIVPEDHIAALREMRRVVRRGGLGLVSCSPEMWQHGLVAQFTRDGLRDLALRSGWRQATVRAIDARLPQAKSYFDLVVAA